MNLPVKILKELLSVILAKGCAHLNVVKGGILGDFKKRQKNIETAQDYYGPTLKIENSEDTVVINNFVKAVENVLTRFYLAGILNYFNLPYYQSYRAQFQYMHILYRKGIS